MKKATIITKIIIKDSTQGLRDGIMNGRYSISKKGHEKDFNVLNAFYEQYKNNLEQCIIVFDLFRSENMHSSTARLYIGLITNIDKETNDNPASICISFTPTEIVDEGVIANFHSNSELNLDKDFKFRSYTIVNHSENLIDQLEIIAKQPYKSERKPFDQQEEAYTEYYEASEVPLIRNELRDPFAQRNIDCRRIYGASGVDHARGEFRRDYERILHSKAYRRLVDKAQIFTASKGDYFRTRMTHTLAVSQIACAISDELHLNTDLTQAIAMAHDLGHTPFGHQGERTLDNILIGKNPVINCGAEKIPYGGFKHNFQSVRVLSLLEEKYIEHPGLDVSLQVLEGVLKHTSCVKKNCTDCDPCDSKCYTLEEFFPTNTECLYPEIPNPTTLEGQIVALADEIAQRGHDIDDCFSAGLLDIEELMDYLNFDKMNDLYERLQNIQETISRFESQNRRFYSKDELICGRVVSEIHNYFIAQAVAISKKNMEKFQESLEANVDIPEDEQALYNDHHRFKSKLIGFEYLYEDSPSKSNGKILCDYLEKIISKRALNCLEVARFDNKASMVVEKLFQAYYANPRLLHNGTLRRMYLDMRSIPNATRIIDFINGDRKVIEQEFEDIKNGDRKKEPSTPEIRTEYELKNKMFVRCIVDYISGMTDTYAINEYHSICEH